MISDYDKFDYDYKTYWKDRAYEDGAERIALKKLLKGVRGTTFLDVGGSYGRLLPLYYKSFKLPIVVDYSLKTLQKNRDKLKKSYPNLELVAANAYAMPFKESTIDAGMMVRVLHHIDRPEDYFKELSRVLSKDSTYIQEFANSIHIKARLRALLRGNLELFTASKHQQPTQHNFEGSGGNETVFLNFHPRYIKDALKNNGFEIYSKTGVSFFRIPVLKRLLPTKLLLALESIIQTLLSWADISPSVVYKTNFRKGGISRAKGKLEEIMCCPKCGSDLKFDSLTSKCTKCSSIYKKKSNIWDMRIQTDEA